MKTYEDEIYDEVLQRQEAPSKKITNALSTKQIVVVTIIGAAIYYYTWLRKPPYFTQNTGLLGFFVLAVVIYFLITRESVQRIITMPQARAIIKREFENMQKEEGILPQGRIYVAEVGKLRRLEGKRVMWHIGVIIEGRKGPEMYRVDIDPYDGIIEGIIRVREGFTGKEVEQVKYIMPRDMMWRNQYPNVYGRRSAYGAQAQNYGQPPGPIFPNK